MDEDFATHEAELIDEFKAFLEGQPAGGVEPEIVIPEEPLWKVKARRFAAVMQKRYLTVMEFAETLYGPENVSFESSYGYNLREMGNYFQENMAERDVNRITVSDDDSNCKIMENYVSEGLFGKEVGTLTIKFPKLTVTDGHRKHEMLDSYFMISLKASLIVCRTRFWRGTRTLAEISSNYLFSHARTSSDDNPQNLCYGDNTSMSNLNAEICNAWDEDSLLMFIAGLHDYLSYESHAGSPYIRIDNIRPPDVRNTYQPPTNVEMDEIYKWFVSDITSVKFDINAVGDGVSINVPISDELWELISKSTPATHLLPFDTIQNRTYESAGKEVEYQRRIDSHNNSLKRSNGIMFRGANIKQVILPAISVDPESPTKKRCHETIRNYVTQKLNRQINEHHITSFHSYAETT